MGKMLALISVVKDEIDVIDYMIDYHIQIGVEAFFIKDNGSTDGTYEALHKRKSKTFKVYRDPDVNHYQSRKMTELANIAFNHGYKYILPLDADELFVKEKGTTMRQICEGLVEPGCAAVDWRNYHNTELDDPYEPIPFRRMTYASGVQKYLFKSLIHWKPGMRIWQGNHGIDNPGQFPNYKLTECYVANFPWRSKEQALKKIISNGVSHAKIRDNADEIRANYNGWLTGGKEWLDSFWKSHIIDSKELEKLPI
jgi:hypothetical protein